MLGIPNDPGRVAGAKRFSNEPSAPAGNGGGAYPISTRNDETVRAFIITIDTEGDDEWARPNPILTRNAAYLPRFQALCDEFGFKTTWLTNYEMAISPEFIRFGREVIDRNVGEIGMHLHAWSSPPIKPLTYDDHATHPYLIEFPVEVMAAKIGFVTDLLQQQFGTKMLSHRAGRWSLNSSYAQLLVEHGYRADCSVTPYISWRETMGDPAGEGGTDFRGFPSNPYFMDLERIDMPGDSSLLEVPMTIIKSKLSEIAPWAYKIRGLRRFAWKYQPPLAWIAPDARNLQHMRRCVRTAVAERRLHIELSIHSSELMPGGSPLFPTEESIERLYSDLRCLFADISLNFQGMTLKEFRALWNEDTMGGEKRDRQPARQGSSPAKAFVERSVVGPGLRSSWCMN